MLMMVVLRCAKSWYTKGGQLGAPKKWFSARLRIRAGYRSNAKLKQADEFALQINSFTTEYIHYIFLVFLINLKYNR